MSILGGMRGGGPGGGGGRTGGPGAGPGSAARMGSAAAAAGPSDVVSITENEFEQEVLRCELPVLIEFSAEWCAPCKQIAPEVASFATEMRGKAKVVKVDIDKSPLLARELRVQSVPTFMIFAEGRIQDGVVGAIRKNKMREMVEPFLPRAAGALKPIELFQLLRTGEATAVDTREAAAFGRARLPGATNMPIDELESRLAELHMLAAQPVLYCRSGDKTKDLAAKLAEQGLPVAFLDGGILAWESDGLPIEK
jgi:thioredoxin